MYFPFFMELVSSHSLRGDREAERVSVTGRSVIMHGDSQRLLSCMWVFCTPIVRACWLPSKQRASSRRSYSL